MKMKRKFSGKLNIHTTLASFSFSFNPVHVPILNENEERTFKKGSLFAYVIPVKVVKQ